MDLLTDWDEAKFPGAEHPGAFLVLWPTAVVATVVQSAPRRPCLCQKLAGDSAEWVEVTLQGKQYGADWRLFVLKQHRCAAPLRSGTSQSTVASE